MEGLIEPNKRTKGCHGVCFFTLDHPVFRMKCPGNTLAGQLQDTSFKSSYQISWLLNTKPLSWCSPSCEAVANGQVGHTLGLRHNFIAAEDGRSSVSWCWSVSWTPKNYDLGHHVWRVQYPKHSSLDIFIFDTSCCSRKTLHAKHQFPRDVQLSCSPPLRGHGLSGRFGYHEPCQKGWSIANCGAKWFWGVGGVERPWESTVNEIQTGHLYSA